MYSFVIGHNALDNLPYQEAAALFQLLKASIIVSDSIVKRRGYSHAQGRRDRGGVGGCNTPPPQ